MTALRDTVVVEPVEARQLRRVIERDGRHAFQAAYPPHAMLPEHEHRHPFFTYVLRGSFTENAGRVTRECRRGAVVLHDHAESHTDVVGPAGTASLNVEIAREIWSELPRGVVPDHRLVGRVLTGDVEWLAIAVWREFHRDDSVTALGLDEAIARLCGEVREAARREMLMPTRRLDACAEYLARHQGSPRLSTAAALVGVHPIHLARQFRKRFGCSMSEFARRRRIASACERLADSTVTIARIAIDAGFADHAHFTRTFRRITGCTPQWYRARLTGARPPRLGASD